MTPSRPSGPRQIVKVPQLQLVVELAELPVPPQPTGPESVIPEPKLAQQPKPLVTSVTSVMFLGHMRPIGVLSTSSSCPSSVQGLMAKGPAFAHSNLLHQHSSPAKRYRADGPVRLDDIGRMALRGSVANKPHLHITMVKRFNCLGSILPHVSGTGSKLATADAKPLQQTMCTGPGVELGCHLAACTVLIRNQSFHAERLIPARQRPLGFEFKIAHRRTGRTFWQEFSPRWVNGKHLRILACCFSAA